MRFFFFDRLISGHALNLFDQLGIEIVEAVLKISNVITLETFEVGTPIRILVDAEGLERSRVSVDEP